ncbi:MAG: AzlD domain-containing protein [Oribacterium sp.]|jgi:branched-subunit amino acid transport protein AzlD|nr:AzlD domain-containing protein [Oribacterium sp.]
MSLYVVLAIFISALITFSLRALPFLLFSGDRRMPDWLSRLGAVLPSAIMAVLIVYCLKGVKSDIIGTGIPSAIAVLVVALSFKWKHNTFLSILSGTAVYMLLLRVL